MKQTPPHDPSKSFLSSPEFLSLDGQNSIDDYVRIVTKSVLVAQTLPPIQKTSLLNNTAQDIINRYNNGTALPFLQAEFLKIIKILLLNLSEPLQSELIGILPSKLKEALQQTQQAVNAKNQKAPQDNTPIFLEKIVEKFSITQLLSIFALKNTGHPESDRAKITPIFTMIQSAYEEFNPALRQIKKDGSFELMCRLRGFVLMYYRYGADLEESLKIFTKYYPNEYGIMAKEVAGVDFGSFMTGLSIVCSACELEDKDSFLDAIASVMVRHFSYTLPNSLCDIILPNSVLFPSFVPFGSFGKSQKSKKIADFGKFSIPIQSQQINIDIIDDE